MKNKFESKPKHNLGGVSSVGSKEWAYTIKILSEVCWAQPQIVVVEYDGMIKEIETCIL
jgi:hypothetical protein